MNEQRWTDLAREVESRPDDVPLRSRLYLELVRVGRAKEQAIALAAWHGDPAAIQILPFEEFHQEIGSLEDLITLVDLPVQQLKVEGDLSDEYLEQFVGLPLQSLTLSDYSEIEVTDSGLKHLAKLPLKELDLDLPNVDGTGFQYLKQRPLDQLTLRSMTLSEKGWKALAELPLRSLYLSRVNITAREIKGFADSSIESLTLDNCPKLDDSVLQAMGDWPLRSLAIHWPVELTDEGLRALSGLSLESFTLAGCHSISKDALQFCVNMPLQSLQINNCEFTDQSLKYLQGLPLKRLSLKSLSGEFSGRGFQVLKGTPLEELTMDRDSRYALDLNSLVGLTDLKALTVSMPDSTDYSALTECSLESLTIHDSNLKQTNFADCIGKMSLSTLSMTRCKLMYEQQAKLLALGPERWNKESCVVWVEDDSSLLHGLPCESIRLGRRSVTDTMFRDIPSSRINAVSLRADAGEWNGISPKFEITDEGLAALAQLPLKSLELYMLKKITDHGISSLAEAPLEHLEIDNYHGQLTVRALEKLNKASLRSLSLSCFEINEENVGSVAQFPLKNLILQNCAVKTETVSKIIREPLEEMTIKFGSGFGNPMLEHVAKSSVRSLKLVDCGVTDEGLSSLKDSRLQRLELINLPGVRLECLKTLVSVPLKHLTLRVRPGLIDGKELIALNDFDLDSLELGTRTERSALSGLEDLSLKSVSLNTYWLEESDCKILSSWPLKHLKLNGGGREDIWPWLKDCSVEHLVLDTSFNGKKFNLSCLPQLRSLTINVDNFLELKNCIKGLQLEKLTVHFREKDDGNISDEDLYKLKDVPLTSLSIECGAYISDRGLASLASHALEHLSLAYSINITDEGLAALKDLPLKSLELEWAQQITNKSLRLFNHLQHLSF